MHPRLPRLFLGHFTKPLLPEIVLRMRSTCGCCLGDLVMRNACERNTAYTVIIQRGEQPLHSVFLQHFAQGDLLSVLDTSWEPPAAVTTEW